MTRRILLVWLVLVAPSAAAHDPSVRERRGPHGGVLAALGWGFVEVLATREGEFQVYVLDWRARTRATEGWKGTAAAEIDGYEEIPLSPAGEGLIGSGAPIQRNAVTARVTLIDPKGRGRTARLEPSPPSVASSTRDSWNIESVSLNGSPAK